MHQIGGPIGLSLIVSTTTNFQTWWMVAFTIIAIPVVAIYLHDEK